MRYVFRWSIMRLNALIVAERIIKKRRDKNSMGNEFDYKSEYIRLWNAAKQLLDN